jgi:hypothetical protein
LVRTCLEISLLVVLLGVPFALAQGLKTSPGEILSNPDRFDHQVVSVEGAVTNLQERVSKAGNAYYTFDLNDGRQAIRVFSFGKASCRAGGATVEGVFTKVKQQGRYTFYNEIEARRVACR